MAVISDITTTSTSLVSASKREDLYFIMKNMLAYLLSFLKREGKFVKSRPM